MGYGLWVIGYGLWVMGYGLRVMGYGATDGQQDLENKNLKIKIHLRNEKDFYYFVDYLAELRRIC